MSQEPRVDSLFMATKPNNICKCTTRIMMRLPGSGMVLQHTDYVCSWQLLVHQRYDLSTTKENCRLVQRTIQCYERHASAISRLRFSPGFLRLPQPKVGAIV